MKRQEEMIQNLLQQIGQLGAQNQRTTRAQNEAGPSNAAPELGGTHLAHVDPNTGRETRTSEQPDSDRRMNAQSGGQTPESSHGIGGADRR